MATFRIYERAATEHKVVEVGFSVPAFFFDWIWALVKHMPWVALLFFLVSTVYFFITNKIYIILFGSPVSTHSFDYKYFAIFALPYKWVIGFFANRLCCDSLERFGYRLIATVSAKSETEALETYMNVGEVQSGSQDITQKSAILEEVLGDWKSRPDLPIDVSQKEHMRRLVPKLRSDLSREDWLTIARLLNQDRYADLRAFVARKNSLFIQGDREQEMKRIPNSYLQRDSSKEG
jgi:hypothetical protein